MTDSLSFPLPINDQRIIEKTPFDVLNVLLLKGGLPVLSAIPTYQGTQGEIILVDDGGATQAIYCYMNGVWVSIGAVDLSGYELLSNKQTDLTASATKYPTVNAVNTGLSLKEDVSNKKIDLSDNSDTFYPSQKAVKTAVDAKQNSLGFTPANQATTLTINGTTYDLTANRSWTIASSGMTYIGSVSPSGVATANFSSIATFQSLVVIFDAVASVNNNVYLVLQISSDNGSTWSSPTSISSTSTGGVAALISGVLNIYNTGQNGKRKMEMPDISNNGTYYFILNPENVKTGITNALQFSFNSGNIAYGDIHLYGI